MEIGLSEIVALLQKEQEIVDSRISQSKKRGERDQANRNRSKSLSKAIHSISSYMFSYVGGDEHKQNTYKIQGENDER